MPNVKFIITNIMLNMTVLISFALKIIIMVSTARKIMMIIIICCYVSHTSGMHV